MVFYRLLTYLLCLLAPIALIANSYLYAYPVFNGCAFPQQSQHNSTSTLASFRLLAFGDPQLEGDTSLPDRPYITPFDRNRLLEYARNVQIQPAAVYVSEVIEELLEVALYHVAYVRKQLDLIGNDFYLAHVYRTLHWFTNPSHVTVLGDLLGSQWIDDEEFASRSYRFWNRVFRGSSVVLKDKLAVIKDGAGSLIVHEEEFGFDQSWSRRIINVPGNHDIGYAGDLDEGRVDRFERAFGPVNGILRFRLNATGPSLRIIVLNSMNMDSPQLSEQLAWDTITAINDAITTARPVEEHDEAVVLLTHIPLHKQTGICVDSPMFSYFEGGSIMEQNFLSYDTGRQAILEGIFGLHTSSESPARGMGRDGIILTGHDHEGCDTYHYAQRESGSWDAKKWSDTETSALVDNNDQPGVREVTVRSMMGEFGGNAALVSAWWDEQTARWSFAVQNCPFVVQHVWWAVHILDVVLLVVFFLWALLRLGQVLAQSSAPYASSQPQLIAIDHKSLADTKTKLPLPSDSQQHVPKPVQRHTKVQTR